MNNPSQQKALVNVLGVVYLHIRTAEGGDLYLTRFAEPHEEHLEIDNWYEDTWFTENRVPPARHQLRLPRADKTRERHEPGPGGQELPRGRGRSAEHAHPRGVHERRVQQPLGGVRPGHGDGRQAGGPAAYLDQGAAAACHLRPAPDDAALAERPVPLQDQPHPRAPSRRGPGHPEAVQARVRMDPRQEPRRALRAREPRAPRHRAPSARPCRRRLSTI